MNLIRKYKLKKLFNIEIDGVEKECISLIESLLTDLIEFNLSEYPDCTFYLNTNCELIVSYDSKNGYVCVSKHEVTNKILLKYNLLMSEYKYIINSILKERYGIISSIVANDSQKYNPYYVVSSFKEKYEIN